MCIGIVQPITEHPEPTRNADNESDDDVTIVHPESAFFVKLSPFGMIIPGRHTLQMRLGQVSSQPV